MLAWSDEDTRKSERNQHFLQNQVNVLASIPNSVFVSYFTFFLSVFFFVFFYKGLFFIIFCPGNFTVFYSTYNIFLLKAK